MNVLTRLEELYPLVSVEYYAVPCLEAVITDILVAVGLTQETQHNASRGKLTSAFCIVAQAKRLITAEEVAIAVPVYAPCASRGGSVESDEEQEILLGSETTFRRCTCSFPARS